MVASGTGYRARGKPVGQEWSLQLGAGQAALRIMATTDVHGQLMPYDYLTDTPLDKVGLVRTASLIAQCRQAGIPHLLLDNGDFLQGTLLSDLAAPQSDSAENPVIRLMNLLHYDAASLGNHEFNFGLAALQGALSQAAFPMLSANVCRRGPDGPVPIGLRWTIQTREVRPADGATQVLQIGLIGFSPPQIPLWDAQALKGEVMGEDILDAARRELPRMRAAGADLVIALCHSGIGAQTERPMMENAAFALAGLPGIDAIISGHSHVAFPDPSLPQVPGIDPVGGTLHRKPAMNPGPNGGVLGVMDLALTHDAGRWRIAGHDVRLLPIHGPGPDGRTQALVPSEPEAERLVADSHARTLALIRQPLGQTTDRLQSFFSRIRADETLALVAQAQRQAVAAALRGTEHEGLPILSAVAPFKSGGRGGPDNFVDIPAGPLALRHAAEFYPYPNTICALELTGAQIRLWLEQSASAFSILHPGRTGQQLLCPEVPGYNFDTLAGLTYTLDLTVPRRFDAEGHELTPSQRVHDLRHEGRPVADGDRFIVATNSYRAGGGGNYRILSDAPVRWEGEMPVPDAISAFIRQAGRIEPAALDNWGIRPVAGATAILHTNPAAQEVMSTVPNLRVIRSEIDRSGFLRCEFELDAGLQAC